MTVLVLVVGGVVVVVVVVVVGSVVVVVVVSDGASVVVLAGDSVTVSVEPDPGATGAEPESDADVAAVVLEVADVVVLLVPVVLDEPLVNEMIA